MPASLEATASAAAAAGEERMASILNCLDLGSVSGSGSSDSSDSGDSKLDNDLPVPRGFLDTHVRSDKNAAIKAFEPQPPMAGPSNFNALVKAQSNPNPEYGSDSGLGTSIDHGQAVSTSDKCKGRSLESDFPGLLALTPQAVQEGQLSIEGLQAGIINRQMAQSAITHSISAFKSSLSEKEHRMSETAAQQIQHLVLDPILKEERLKPFHSLVQNVPHQIAAKEIKCLRDVEKTLLWLAPVSPFPSNIFGVGSLTHFIIFS